MSLVRAATRALSLALALASLPWLALPADAVTPAPGTDAWFALHAFVGTGGCLVVREGQRLEEGDRIQVFAAGRPSATRRIASLISADSARRIFDTRGFHDVYRDRALWTRIGCYWFLRDAAPPPIAALARLDWPDSLNEDAPLALDGATARALTAGGEGTPLSPAEIAAVERRHAARLPSAFASGKRLRAGRRYPAGGGHELLEVLIGKPFESPGDPGPPVDSIAIRRLFLDAGRLLAIDTLFRASGVEEHVDVEPPQLDEDNWHQISEETLGFVSFDDGASWARLTVDVGFEGVFWAIRQLDGGRRERWSYYLYTRH